ncbi:MAG: excinuclease ABC subunit UvrC [Eubacterium sp.]|jgi:excinuclease ABC subunit C
MPAVQKQGETVSEYFDFSEELKKLPDDPGVYLMHDERDAIIYIGKAVNLKRRVRQYFRSGGDSRPKIAKMMPHVRRFEYIVTDSELEALVLENNLIKEHRPKYNTMLKDDKTYPYVKVTLGETYPRILLSRQMKKDKSRYFGPYTSAGAVRDTIELLCRLYRIRTCSRVLPRDEGKERACLNYHIHQCSAPCQGLITPEEYRKRVDQALAFLGGSHQPVIQKLEAQMQEAAEALDFEKAAELRDLTASVRAVAQKQKITSTDGEDRDIVAVAKDSQDAVVQVFFVRGGRLIGREHFHVTLGNEDDKSAVLSAFIRQYYAGTPYIPKEILLQAPVEDQPVVEHWLSEKLGSAVHLRVPKKGAREKLVELAASNARLVLTRDKEKIKREERRTIGAVKEVGQWLGLPGISRMEAYDISNTSGCESVGSMVVYEKGRPRRSEYRKFRIRTVTGPDDYASMREVLSRRFSHGLREQKEQRVQGNAEEVGRFSRFPDLILMDGGKGQVNVALEVLESLGLRIPVCGMVKDDYHRTRGLYYNNREITPDKSSEGFRLITRMQDEAHRFAIEYHRSLRAGKQIHSILDDIPDIGPGRRKALMRQFASVEAIRQASVEELAQTPSMNQKAAQSVYAFFRTKENRQPKPEP